METVRLGLQIIGVIGIVLFCGEHFVKWVGRSVKRNAELDRLRNIPRDR